MKNLGECISLQYDLERKKTRYLLITQYNETFFEEKSTAAFLCTTALRFGCDTGCDICVIGDELSDIVFGSVSLLIDVDA